MSEEKLRLTEEDVEALKDGEVLSWSFLIDGLTLKLHAENEITEKSE